LSSHYKIKSGKNQQTFVEVFSHDQHAKRHRPTSSPAAVATGRTLVPCPEPHKPAQSQAHHEMETLACPTDEIFNRTSDCVKCIVNNQSLMFLIHVTYLINPKSMSSSDNQLISMAEQIK